jgi:hypothetical protein
LTITMAEESPRCTEGADADVPRKTSSNMVACVQMG